MKGVYAIEGIVKQWLQKNLLKSSRLHAVGSHRERSRCLFYKLPHGFIPGACRAQTRQTPAGAR
jgi:hypothetical protein